MAKIDLKKLRAAMNGDTCRATIGNNRIAYSVRDGGTAGALHGHEIVTFNPDTGILTLNPRGYHTTTTRQAMQDMAGAMTGRRVGVSFARGDFTARIAGKDYSPNADGYIVAQL